jgi:hypothetical protein
MMMADERLSPVEFLYGKSITSVLMTIIETAVNDGRAEAFNQAYYRMSGINWLLSSLNDPKFEIIWGKHMFQMKQASESAEHRAVIIAAYRKAKQQLYADPT